MTVSVRLQILGLNARDLEAIPSSEKGTPGGVASLSSNEAKLLNEQIPYKVLTWDSFNGAGGVPQIDSSSLEIPEWVIPASIKNKIAELEQRIAVLEQG